MTEVSETPGIEYRSQKGRYPWWVKTVDHITTETDKEQAKRPHMTKTTALFARHSQREDYETFIQDFPEIGLKYHLGTDKMLALWHKKWERTKRTIEENQPGHSLRDWAFTNTTYGSFLSFDFNLTELTKKTQYVNLVKRLGVESWQGSKQEASKMVELVCKSLGATQIGISLVDPQILYAEAGETFPKELKYAISIACDWAPEGTKRMNTPLGDTSIFTAWLRMEKASWGLRNYIYSLGFKAKNLPGPDPAYAVLSGLGELGRTNRLVSPVLGTGMNLITVATDMPLAIDKPIDFGLQEFCKRCKKCAEHCPVGALSMDDEPSWEPRGEWNAPGKKTYFEDSPRCASYCFRQNTACALCFAVCPWNKQDKTLLHDVSKALSAKLPFAAKLMVKMDDIFGYGPTKKPDVLEEWWKMDSPLR